MAQPAFPGVAIHYPSPHVAHLSICSPRANALSLDLWRSLAASLRHLEGDGSTLVLVISSGLDRDIFSAGNDLRELHAPSTTMERFTEFWLVSTKFLAALYESPLYTICAMRGACPAGGCIIGLCCDERIALQAKSFRLGLNEAAIGIVVPHYWAQLMLTTGNSRSEVEKMLCSGRMVGADEALRLDLVDRVVSGSPKDLNDAADRVASELARKLGNGMTDGFRATKRTIRAEFSRKWSSYAEDEAKASWDLLSSRSVSDQLGTLLGKLQRSRAVRAGAKL